MADNTEIAAIIGGSIGGLIVFVIIVSIIIYMLCGSRNRRKRQEKKFQQVSRHHDKSPHSQNSTMSHLSAERLPKVGSNGLWMGNPGVYAASPSPAYFYGRPYPPGVRAPMDNRMQPFPGHAVYQSNNSMSNLRIYHSQQLSPVYEYIDPTHGPNVVDIYQYGDLNHSRSRLIDQSSSWKKQKDKNDKKILRSKSDATQDVRRHVNRKRSDTNRSAETRSSSHSNSKSGKSQEARADIHISKKDQKSRSSDAIHMGYDNKAFERDSGLATDSMKLQATKVNPINNITDDEKKHVTSPQDKIAKAADPVSHYTYQGDIYATSDKTAETSNNPILDKMNSMKLQTPNARAPRYIVEDTIDGADVHASRVNNSAKQEVNISDTIYTEVRPNVSENIIVTEVLDNNGSDTRSHDNNGPDTRSHDNNGPNTRSHDNNGPDTRSHDNNGPDTRSHDNNNSNNNALLQPQPSTSHNLLASSPSLLSDRSELSEDLGVKGKNVTTAAFEFLESYLSDDDETTGESRPTSPAT